MVLPQCFGIIASTLSGTVSQAGNGCQRISGQVDPSLAVSHQRVADLESDVFASAAASSGQALGREPTS